MFFVGFDYYHPSEYAESETRLNGINITYYHCSKQISIISGISTRPISCVHHNHAIKRIKFHLSSSFIAKVTFFGYVVLFFRWHTLQAQCVTGRIDNILKLANSAYDRVSEI